MVEAFSSPRRVAVVTTGGTIASQYDATRRALMSVMPGAQLLAAVSERVDSVEIVVEEFSNLGSNLIDLEMALGLARRIEALIDADDICGCVVTHGTDTLEESAFLTDLIVSSEKPIVFTGAQRPADALDADGPRNLIDAISVAACPDAAGIGTVVVFGGQILSAFEATKVHTTQLAAFEAPSSGSLGEVVNGAVMIWHRPGPHPVLPPSPVGKRVDLLTLTMGVDTCLFEAACSAGAAGIVLEAFGCGNATPALVEAVRQATCSGVAVVVASRCQEGRVLPLYGAGGGSDLAEAGAIFAGRLQGPKARILLTLALAQRDLTGLRELFAAMGR